MLYNYLLINNRQQLCAKDEELDLQSWFSPIKRRPQHLPGRAATVPPTVGLLQWAEVWQKETKHRASDALLEHPTEVAQPWRGPDYLLHMTAMRQKGTNSIDRELIHYLGATNY